MRLKFHHIVIGRAVGTAINLTRFVPISWLHKLLPGLGVGSSFVVSRYRKQALGHLSMMLGNRFTLAEKQRMIRSLFRSLGAMIAAYLELVYWGLARSRSLVINDPEPVQVMDKLLQQGRGLIVVTAHFGGWELIAPYVASYFPKCSAVVAARLNNPYLQDLTHRLRTQMGVSLFYRSEGRRKLVRHLQSGGILGLLPDLETQKVPGISIPFLGRDAYTPTGPASLSLLAGCPILPAFMIHQSGREYYLELADPIEPRPQDNKKGEIYRITQAWSDSVERVVLRRPEQWMWFTPRGRTDPETLNRRRQRRKEKRLKRIRESNSSDQPSTLK